ncbi:oxoglutarate/iron-dependent oxygenase [Phyllosticta capitalensis]|uniref:Oxoglutarate/iron-dependent oxygenase n=1 Tax=Phyllosticta capitalensis TaxID=121624 RepID=A0ABR1YJ14_9PEZI
MIGLLKLLGERPFEILAASAVVYFASVAIYRLYFSNIAKFPGPKLAALTYFYEFYYDWWQPYRFQFKIAELHKEYGPIIRITPTELHVSDPSFIDTLYASGNRKREKYLAATKSLNLGESAFGTVTHDLHRIRRGAMNRFFSKASVAKLEPTIVRLLNKFCERLEQNAGTGQPIVFDAAISCFTTDVVSLYAFGIDTKLLDVDDFRNDVRITLEAGLKSSPVCKQWPWVGTFLESLPESVTVKMAPEFAEYFKLQNNAIENIKRVEAEVAAGEKPKTDMGTTVFHELVESNLPAYEKSVERLWQEGQSVIGAGTETVTWTLAVIFFHIFTKPRIMKKLMDEIVPIFPNPDEIPSQASLERLQYLTATIFEGLRLSYGLVTRLPRVSPVEPMIFRSTDGKIEKVIPPGVAVGMSSLIVHHDKNIWGEDADEFRPERWLDEDGQKRRDLDAYLLSFSKGTRMCLGLQLGYSELYLALPTVLRRFEGRLELFETDITDIEVAADIIVPRPRLDSKGVRVLVKPKAN